MFDELTSREYLRYLARLRELDTTAAAERIDDLLSQFDLLADADRRVDSYSTGIKKKLGIIGATLHEPAVLFLDEPTSGLDPRAARTMRDTLADREMTVFLSTHLLSVADELADVVGVIHDGDLVAQGHPAELKDRTERTSAVDPEIVFLKLPHRSAKPRSVTVQRREPHP